MTEIRLAVDQWYSAAVPTQAGSQDSDDITNSVNVAIQSLIGALNAVGFIENTKNFITAMEEFGEGMEAALACISIDLALVSSGVKAAAAAFSSLDARLAGTFAQLDQQIGYFTNTASSVTLSQPTAAQENSLLSILGESNPGTGIHLSLPNPGPLPSSSGAAAGAGVVGTVIAVLGILALA